MKKKLRALLSLTLAGIMLFGLSLTTLAADGEELTGPAGGLATVTQEDSEWKVVNDDDAKAKAADDDQTQIGVFAKVSIEGKAVYKIDIAWGNMKFSYTNDKRRWDPATHTYSNDNEGTIGWDASFVDGTNNKINITNHSNSAVNAGLTYAHNLTSGASMFNAAPEGADAVRGHFFTTNAAAVTASAVLAGSATVVGPLTGTREISACPEGATVAAGNIPNIDTFFTLNGTPDANATEVLGGDFTKVGIITVTIGS